MSVANDVPTAPPLMKRLAEMDQGYLVGGFVILLAAVFALTVHGFATSGNMVNIALATSGLGILALGQAIVVVARGLDLSIVAIYGVTAQFVAYLLNNGSNEAMALLYGLLVAVALGLVNGVLVAYVDIPSLFVTLATSLLFLGAFRLFVFNDSVTFSFPTSAKFIGAIGSGDWLGLPISLYLWIGLAAGMWWMASNTAFGRMIYARGDNPATASLTGMPTRPLTMFTFVVSAVLGFVAGMVIAGAAGDFDTHIISAGTQLYDVLAIVVIGGVSLAGGRGSVLGVVAATLLIGIVFNGTTLLDLGPVQQAIVKSLIVLVALVFDRWLHPPNEETARTGEL